MQIKIKHQPGDIVYFIHDNKIIEGCVESVSININSAGTSLIYYITTTVKTFKCNETSLFSSTQAACKHLVSSLTKLKLEEPEHNDFYPN